MRVFILLLLLLPCALSTVTLPANKLFQNTLKRWHISPLNDPDRSERWRRFLGYKAVVDANTQDVLLESLNRLTVLNDEEFAIRTAPYKRGGLNITHLHLPSSSSSSTIPQHRISKRSSSMPATYDYWETTIGLHPAGSQLSCGSCWSFPDVGAMEAIYKQLTGEFASFSEQYFVDCTFPYSGCAGGTANQGYKTTLMRQYLMYETDHPYTASYTPCAFASEIESFTNNAMKKMWLQEWYPLTTTEEGVFSGLQYSPVAIGVMIGNNLLGYSGGTWSDTSCVTNPAPHSMLLVGYTETTIRVKNSYGADWGDSGYVNYLRSGTLASCEFWKGAFFILGTQRRELEYVFCNDNKVDTRDVCQASCHAMNSNGATGWDLAVIPTKYHNELVVQMVNAVYPGKKSNDKFNLLWIGITDLDKVEIYSWVDGYTPTNYVNFSDPDVGKYGMINKNTGVWLFKNSQTYTARGLCSRAKTCWDISSAVEKGVVTFDRSELTEGTIATAACNSDYGLEGVSTLTCVTGNWDQTLPTCTCTNPGGCTDDSSGVTEECAAITVDQATITPTQPVNSGTDITITCNNGYELSGSSTLTCSGTSFSGTTPTCTPVVSEECDTITIENAQLSGATQPASSGEEVTVTCNEGYTLSGTAQLTCDGSSFGTLPQCTIQQCTAITVDNGQITPAQPVNYGVTVTVTCDQDYVISGSSELLCQGTSGFNAATPTCVSISNECPVISVENAEITGATQPTTAGQAITVTCNQGFTISGQDTLTCSGTTFDETAPVCETCNELTVTNSILTPGNAGTVMVACINNGYELIGDSQLQCEMCLDDYRTDTIMCKGPSFADGATPECRLRPGSCPGGTHYTEDGCVTCPTGHWMAGGDNANSDTNGCNTCPGIKTSAEGSTSSNDCHYTLCTCKMLESPGTGGKYVTSCTCM